MRRLLGLLAMLTTVTLALTLAPATAGPAVSERRGVSSGDLPTVRQVAKIYPWLEGGSREVLSHRDISVPDRDCLYWRSGARASSGRMTWYYDRWGDMPYFKGYQSPTVSVLELRTKERARKVLAKVRRTTKRCLGRHTDSDGSFIHRSTVETPRIGTGKTFGYRTYQRSPNVLTTWSYARFVDVWGRKGRHLINVSVQKETSRPSLAKTIRLTRVTVRKVR